jgi:hypothetical protein
VDGPYRQAAPLDTVQRSDRYSSQKQFLPTYRR